MGDPTATGVPEIVRAFVAAHIESVEQLETLLLLRACAGEALTAVEVSSSASSRSPSSHSQ